MNEEAAFIIGVEYQGRRFYFAPERAECDGGHPHCTHDRAHAARLPLAEARRNTDQANEVFGRFRRIHEALFRAAQVGGVEPAKLEGLEYKPVRAFIEEA